jgi:hypothetical protein
MTKVHLVVVAAILSACASAPSARAAARPAPRDIAPDYITTAEVAATPVSNVYDLINRLRPQWFRTSTGSIRDNTRNQVIAVYLDDARIGDVGSLRNISTSGVSSLRYYDATRAATVLRNPGPDPIAGAIVISTSNAP